MTAIKAWLCAAIAHLKLDNVNLQVDPTAHCALPHLSHLHLSNIPSANNRPCHLFAALTLPRLTHLAWHQTESVQVHRLIDIGPVLAQLTFLALFDQTGACARFLILEARTASSLETLIWGEPSTITGSCCLRLMLSQLPAGLRTLDVAAGPFGSRLADAAWSGFRLGFASLSRLELLRLPRTEGLAVSQVEAEREVAERLEKVAETAQARGIRVELV